MELVWTDQMRSIEQRAALEYGLDFRTLMESAGLAAFELVKKVLGGSVAGRLVLICAGKGNNGGDALVLARYLANGGAKVVIVFAADKSSVQGPAAQALQPVIRMVEDQTLTLIECTGPNWEAALPERAEVDLVVDGLLGTGIKAPLTGVYRDLVLLINQLDCPCVALDIPTGINPDTGQIQGVGVKADYTITFGRPKVGLFCYPAPEFVGQLTVGTIGIPDSLVNRAKIAQYLVQPNLIAKILPLRPDSAHKGSFGHVLTIGGSVGLTGAACLAAEASLRSGAGKATLAGPAGLHSIFAAKLTEVMTIPLPDTETHCIAAEASEVVCSLGDFETILIGPGLSAHRETARFLADFIPRAQGRLVLDADALNIMAAAPENFGTPLRQLDHPAILTPHPGEMARLLGVSIQEVQQARVAAAREAAERWSSIVVLKGANTVITSPAGVVYVNTTGGPELATAGTGDVLAGVIAGFLAQGVSPEQAAVLGVYVHGLAGKKACQAGLSAGLIAGDLLQFLPVALQECRQYQIRK